jgi:hypothetical protein
MTMANFFDPYNPKDDYDKINLLLRVGQSKTIGLWGGGPGGEDLSVTFSKAGVVSRSQLTPFPNIDHTRVFTVTALRKGFVKVYGNYNDSPWAEMWIHVAGRVLMLKEPPAVGQFSTMMCWAAAMESFLRARGESDNQHTLRAKFATHAESGGLEATAKLAETVLQRNNGRALFTDEVQFAKTHNLEALCDDKGVRLSVHSGASLNYDVFESLMKSRGRVFVCMNYGSVSHCVIVYGIIESGENPASDTLYVMDPNHRGGYTEFPMFKLQSLSQVVIGVDF